jgi:hypothetical protein
MSSQTPYSDPNHSAQPTVPLDLHYPHGSSQYGFAFAFASFAFTFLPITCGRRSSSQTQSGAPGDK